MMEVRIDSELTMDGSEGCGGLSTRDHHYQKWVSFLEKGKDVDGGHFSSRDTAITNSGLTKNGSFCASDVDAEVGTDEARSTFDLPLDLQCSEPQCSDPINYKIEVIDSDSYNRSGHRDASSGARVSVIEVSAVAKNITADQDVAAGQSTFSGASPSDLEVNSPTKDNRSISNVPSYCTAGNGATATSGMDAIGAISLAEPVNDVAHRCTASDVVENTTS